MRAPFILGGLLLTLACGCSSAPGSADPDADGGSAEDAGADAGVDGGVDAGPGFVWPSADVACTPATKPSKLSETCLYSDFASRTVRSDVVAYAPAHELWSDGAAKERYLWLPPGTRIDTSDMDAWQFPVGTRSWKQFSLNGVPLEVRLIQRTGPGANDYEMVSFVWRADGSDADAVSLGRNNVLGTEHDVPSSNTCTKCHNGEPGRILGFSAVQLSHAGPGLTLSALASAGKMTVPPPAGADYSAPGNAVEAKALGYLNANCGHCHNPNGEAFTFVDMILALDVAAAATRDPTQTKAYTTTIGKKTTALLWRQSPTRVVAGDAAASDMWLRMGKRSSFFPPPDMPPYGTEKVDDEGRAAIAAWINAL